MLPEFESDKYFTIKTDHLLEEKHQQAIKLKPDGCKKIIDYYKKRFGTEMDFFDGSVTEFVDRSALKLYEAREKKLQRCVFVINNVAHSLPVTYVNEDGVEAWIFAEGFFPYAGDAESLFSNTGLPVYFIPEKRQTDSYSCHAEALLFGKELSGRSGADFKTPRILEFLSEHSKMVEPGVFHIEKLPQRLLKSWQTAGHEKFFTESEKPVRRAESWSEFRGKTLRFDAKEKKPINHYMREKGLNFGRVIEAEFYSEELAKIHGEKWSSEVEMQFLRKAHNAENIREFAQKFEEKISLEDLGEAASAGAGSAR